MVTATITLAGADGISLELNGHIERFTSDSHEFTLTLPDDRELVVVVGWDEYWSYSIHDLPKGTSLCGVPGGHKFPVIRGDQPWTDIDNLVLIEMQPERSRSKQTVSWRRSTSYVWADPVELWIRLPNNEEGLTVKSRLEPNDSWVITLTLPDDTSVTA